MQNLSLSGRVFGSDTYTIFRMFNLTELEINRNWCIIHTNLPGSNVRPLLVKTNLHILT